MAFQESDLQHKPDEVEFFAEDELITIVPNFSLPTRNSTIHGILGEWGPFEPNFPIDVPLWMAIYLFQRKQCRIEPPDWLVVDSLQAAYEQERREPNNFVQLPNHFLEIAHILLIDAKSCFSARQYLETRDLVDQLRRLRSNKINDGLAVLAGPMTAKLNRVCAFEINTIRPFFLQAQDRYLKLSKMDEGSASGAATQSTQEDDTQPAERRQLGR